MSPAALDAPEVETALGQMVPIGLLNPSPLNPRKKFDDASLADLAANIQKRGEVIVPLILRAQPAGGFEIVDGERRFRASIRAGNVSKLPAVFRNDLTDGEVIEIQLLSAIQRQELTPLEEASGYKALIDSNPSRYSAAYIADRIGRSEKYVWDTMKLLDLVPAAKALLEREKMLVGHARVIAKLKPEDQERVISPTGRALFEDLDVPLPYHEDGTDVDLYEGKKARTVAELEDWIRSHVKFDIQHAAQAAPLDFGPAADKVQEAAAKPGRGKKVIQITFDSYVQPDAKADGEKIFGPRSWRRADGTAGTTIMEYPKRKVLDSPACEYAVLGVVAIGEHYGETFDVCIARDRCETHWKAELAEKRKNDELRSQGKGKQAARNENTAAKREQEQWEKQRVADELKRKIWQAIAKPLVAEGVRQVKGTKALTPKLASALEKIGRPEIDLREVKKLLGTTWYKQLPAALLVSVFTYENTHWGSFEEFIANKAKPLGLDIKKLEQVRDAHWPKDVPAPTAKKGGKR